MSTLSVESVGQGLRSSALQPAARVRAMALARSRSWVGSHAPELALVSLGISLRLAALHSYEVVNGFDFGTHQSSADWWQTNFAMPPLLLSRGSYHPQLYYLICGLARRLGAGYAGLQVLSVLTGCARLAVLWWAAERYLPSVRAARLSLLALAAVLPVAVQMDAMMTQEPLSNLLALLFAVCLLELCGARAVKRTRWGLLLGFLTGLSLLTKVSNLVLLGVLGLGGLLELLQRRDLDPHRRVVNLSTWLLAGSVALAMATPQYIYNQRVYGTAFPDGWYKRPTADTIAVGSQRREVLDRRSLGFVFGFTTNIIRYPYYPVGTAPESRFWSALIASSYCDYFNYRFGPPVDGGGSLPANGRSVGSTLSKWASASVASGIAIALVIGIGWLVALPRMLARREVARPLLLSIPALGVCGALYFAIQYPYDFEGVIKGHYLHFVSPALYALFGCSVAWLFRQRYLAPLGWLAVSLIFPPAAYTALCVFR